MSSFLITKYIFHKGVHRVDDSLYRESDLPVLSPDDVQRTRDVVLYVCEV